MKLLPCLLASTQGKNWSPERNCKFEIKPIESILNYDFNAS